MDHYKQHLGLSKLMVIVSWPQKGGASVTLNWNTDTDYYWKSPHMSIEDVDPHKGYALELDITEPTNVLMSHVIRDTVAKDRDAIFDFLRSLVMATYNARPSEATAKDHQIVQWLYHAEDEYNKTLGRWALDRDARPRGDCTGCGEDHDPHECPKL